MIDYTFLVGAPKCGTSSLFGELVRHPHVYGTNPKETYALLEDSHPLARRQACRGVEQLVNASIADSATQQLGDHGRNSALTDQKRRVLLEGTTHNLYSPQAIASISALGERALSIAMLRQPSRRILSSFLYTKHNLGRVDRKLAFKEYVNWLIDGQFDKIRQAVPHPVSSHVLTAELNYSDYGPILRSWQDAVGDENFMCIVSEEYFEHPREQISRILCRLELTSEDMAHAEAVWANETRSIKYPRVQRFARWLNSSVPGTRHLGALKALYFACQRRSAGDDDDSVTDGLFRLDEYFRPRVEEVFNFLGRPIDAWKKLVEK